MKYTDAHCHIIAPLRHSDVVAQICNATTEDDWEKLVQIADECTRICIGIHPWHIGTATDGWDRRMYETLQSNPHIMVGEIGIDKHHPDLDTQINFFVTQLEIAIELNRPLHLHIVGEWDKILHILKEHRNLPPIIAHSFNGNSEIIKQLVTKYDVYFSYKLQNSRIIGGVQATPIDRIIIESDCDTPDNQLQILADTTHEIAKILGDNVHKLNEQINKNFSGVINYA